MIRKKIKMSKELMMEQKPARWWQAYFLPQQKTTNSCIQLIWFLTLLL